MEVKTSKGKLAKGVKGTIAEIKSPKTYGNKIVKGSGSNVYTKWAITENARIQRGRRPFPKWPPNSLDYVTPCINLKDLEAQLKGQMGVWETYPLKKPFGPKKQEQYEQFCHGYLYFYDNHVDSANGPHTFYVDWSVAGQVRLLLYPVKVNYLKTVKYQMYLTGDDPPPPPPPPPPPMDA
jgi:hypothetical protein